MRANRIIRDAHDQVEQAWLARIADFVVNGDRSKIEQLISQHCGGQPCKLIQQIDGGFNYCLKALFDDDGKEWILRFPKPGCAMRPIEKIQSEFAVMRFIAQYTSIPVQRAIACGIVEGELSWLGPYIIMEAMEGEPLSGLILDEADRIRSDISDMTMKRIYRQIANVLLELNSHTFNMIGSLHLHEDNGKDVWTVRQKPMTMKSNEIERMGGLTSDGKNGSGCFSLLLVDLPADVREQRSDKGPIREYIQVPQCASRSESLLSRGESDEQRHCSRGCLGL